MKVMYISKELNGVSGANAATRFHLACLQSIFGTENIYIVDISWNAACETDECVAYGKYRGKVEHLIRNLQLNTVYISNTIIKDILDRIKSKKIDAVFIDDSTFGKLVYKIKQFYPSMPVVSFYHDVKMNLYPQWLKAKGFRFISECLTGMWNEYINQKYVDINIVLNDREDDLFYKYYNKKADFLLPVGVNDPGRPTDDKMNEESLFTILFVGKYYYPNVVGIKWFCDKVMPLLSSECVLNIVGHGMEKITDLPDDIRINLIGGVDDLSDYYRNSNIVIGPIFDGAGMKVKTAEAFSYGKYFVGTEESLVGYEDAINRASINEKITLCKNEFEFAEKINELIINGCPLFDEKIYSMYQDNYSMSACRAVLDHAFDSMQK